MTMNEFKKFLPALAEYPDAPVTKWEIGLDIVAGVIVASIFAWFLWMG